MIVLYDCDEPGKKLAREVIQAILPVVSSLRVVNIEPLYSKAVERLRSLVDENTDHELDKVNLLIGMGEDFREYASSHTWNIPFQDPLNTEREWILNHPPKGADVSDYLDVLRASRSPDSDWSESEDRLEVRNLIHSGHTFTVNPHWNIETQLPFLDWENRQSEELGGEKPQNGINRQSEARTSSLDVIRNPVTIPFHGKNIARTQTIPDQIFP